MAQQIPIKYRLPSQPKSLIDKEASSQLQLDIIISLTRILLTENMQINQSAPGKYLRAFSLRFITTDSGAKIARKSNKQIERRIKVEAWAAPLIKDSNLWESI